ncbi:DUF4899 domain-containing protein [Geotoga petraea]|uniref:DUF4899 domain-containing protein n=1 Tax=Geotoga petraea TaxID=28234 RepID=A0A4Z0VW64_9BACT|nr:DUF4899 domain-containing protein [Geotoga petraea]TGG88251.1 DUF4899 domain-containing protein [Geotoga petraea]
MDFYAIKFMSTSDLTGETFVGYIFGKKKQMPEFNVLVLNKKNLRQYELPDLNLDYIQFKSKIDQLAYEITRDKDLASNNRQFKAYFYTTLKKYGLEIIGSKLFLSVEEGDPFVIKAIVQDILYDWGGETQVKLIAQKYFYEDLTWLQAAEKEGEEGVYEYLKRGDVQNAIEVFPVIDPIDGFPIINLDVGDPLTVIRIDDESKKEKIPVHLISKEMIPGTNFLFLKIDLGEGIVGKTVVQKNLKVNVDTGKLEDARKRKEEIANGETEAKIIGDINDEFGGSKKFRGDSKLSSFDLILIMSFSIVGILLIVLIGIWLGAF